jgi:hypothetical protein
LNLLLKESADFIVFVVAFVFRCLEFSFVRHAAARSFSLSLSRKILSESAYLRTFSSSRVTKRWRLDMFSHNFPFALPSLHPAIAQNTRS